MYDETIARRIVNDPFTKFASVNKRTDLESLDLNWREQDLPERERTKHVHRLHPYLGKFVPQLVEIFLRKYRPTLVYDPFCGSGTTLVESNALGIDSIGTDISVFNKLLSGVKTAEYDMQVLKKEVGEVLRDLENPKINLSKYKTKNLYVKNWFSEKSQKDLLHFLDLIENSKYPDFFKIILSRSARSARLVPHYDLDFPKNPQTTSYYCYKHRRTCTPVSEAKKFLTRYLIDGLERVEEFSKIRTNASVTINHSDSREVKLPKGIDMVFTSPPYIGLIDYHDQHKYAYEILGLQNNEIKEIGPAKNGKSERAKREYIDGINEVLIHTRDYMAPKSLALIVVNDRHNLYNAEAAGFKALGKIDRHVNRRTGMRDTPFFESILIWQKA